MKEFIYDNYFHNHSHSPEDINPIDLAQISGATSYANIYTRLQKHMQDKVHHITKEERDAWNKAVEDIALITGDSEYGTADYVTKEELAETVEDLKSYTTVFHGQLLSPDEKSGVSVANGLKLFTANSTAQFGPSSIRYSINNTDAISIDAVDVMDVGNSKVTVPEISTLGKLADEDYVAMRVAKTNTVQISENLFLFFQNGLFVGTGTSATDFPEYVYRVNQSGERPFDPGEGGIWDD